MQVRIKSRKWGCSQQHCSSWPSPGSTADVNQQRNERVTFTTWREFRSNEGQPTWTTWNKVDYSYKCSIELMKPDTKGSVLHDSIFRNLEMPNWAVLLAYVGDIHDVCVGGCLGRWGVTEGRHGWCWQGAGPFVSSSECWLPLSEAGVILIPVSWDC